MRKPGMSRKAAGRLISGFSLLELLCVLAIIALLASFAWPSYREQHARGGRMAAMLALYRAAQYLDANGGAASQPNLPTGLTQAPTDGRASYLVRKVARDDVPGYELIAHPVPGGSMRNDACGDYVLRDDGTRLNRDARLAVATCWMSG